MQRRGGGGWTEQRRGAEGAEAQRAGACVWRRRCWANPIRVVRQRRYVGCRDGCRKSYRTHTSQASRGQRPRIAAASGEQRCAPARRRPPSLPLTPARRFAASRTCDGPVCTPTTHAPRGPAAAAAAPLPTPPAVERTPRPGETGLRRGLTQPPTTPHTQKTSGTLERGRMGRCGRQAKKWAHAGSRGWSASLAALASSA